MGPEISALTAAVREPTKSEYLLIDGMSRSSPDTPREACSESGEARSGRRTMLKSQWSSTFTI
jgi:hypothetical protein